MISLQVSISKQTLQVYDNKKLLKTYTISTAKNGPGEKMGSEQTPRGRHIIRAKIGEGCKVNSIFVGRRPTGEIYTPEMKVQYPGRDWILTRILWLSGLEIGKNRLGEVDSMRRYIYVHGTSDEALMGVPASKGCVRMRNQDIIELFDKIPCYTALLIFE